MFYYLKKYREYLIIIYLYVKKNKIDEALSLLPIIQNYEKKILFLVKHNQYYREVETVKNILKKISFILEIIEKKLKYQEKKITINSNDFFIKEISFLLKKFLQEKGLE